MTTQLTYKLPPAQSILARGENPYLDQHAAMASLTSMLELDTESPLLMNVRVSLVPIYGFAVPNAQAIDRLVSLSPIVEIGAGTGYWAAMVTDAGGTVVAYDLYPPCTSENPYALQAQWHPVLEGGADWIPEHPHSTLFLCWPPEANDMAADALWEYAGDTFVYVGEPRGERTATPAFFDLLDRDWRLDEYIPLPQWSTCLDGMYIYVRK